MLSEEPLDSFASISAKLLTAQTEIGKLTGRYNQMISGVTNGLQQASAAINDGRTNEARLLIKQILATLTRSSSGAHLN